MRLNKINMKLYSIDIKDVSKALVVAVLTGAVLPVSAIIQTPGFDFATANWEAIFSLALNGAIAGFVSYLVKNFFSDESGKVFGRIG